MSSYEDRQVRVTHTPTGLVTKVDFTRSQVKNKALALKHMQGKLWVLKNLFPDAQNMVRGYTEADIPGMTE